MPAINIHFETFDEKSFKKIEDLAAKGPIAISIAPYQISRIQDYQIDRLKHILSQKGYILGQQGLNHKCLKCKNFHFEKKDGKTIKAGIDPWHENYCLWLGKIPVREQENFMKEGRAQLKRLLNIEPQLYVPPNHYFDTDTVKIAARMGYKWLTDRTLLPLKPYALEGIIIVPEGEPEIDASQIYIHADRWRGDLDKTIAKGLHSFDSIKPSKNKKSLLAENRMRKIVGKIARDLQKGYGIEEINAKECAKLLYETKFLQDPFF